MSFKVTLAPDGGSFEVADGERILTAARRAGIWLPFECGWGSCSTCKVTLLEGEVDLLFAGAPAITPRDARRGRILTCQTTPRSDLVIKPLSVSAAPGAARPTSDHRAELVARDELGPEIGRFCFRLERPARYREGQYAVLDFGAGLRRCYSMSNRPGSDVVEFVTKRYAGRPGSDRLHDLPLGSVIDLELPYGDVWLRPGTRPVVLIAGGTGLSPILALARRLRADADPRRIRAFYGAGSRPELVCWDELAALLGDLPDGRLHGALVHADDAWTGTVGFVTDAMDRHLAPTGAADYYLAGPPPMVDAVLDHLRARAVELDRIHYDRFG